MKLFLMRHGEAEPYRQDDASRALTYTGKASVAAKQSYLPVIDSLVVSPYLRALQSADILVEHGLKVKHRQVDDRLLPECSIEVVAAYVIQENIDTQLLVAHNPLLSRLVRLLCGAEARGISLDTAQVACIEADEFLPGICTLLWIK